MVAERSIPALLTTLEVETWPEFGPPSPVFRPTVRRADVCPWRLLRPGRLADWRDAMIACLAVWQMDPVKGIPYTPWAMDALSDRALLPPLWRPRIDFCRVVHTLVARGALSRRGLWA